MKRYCFHCGQTLRHSILEDDDQERWNCAHCGFVVYENPTPVVLVVVEAANRMLLIRRALAPYKDRWAVPGGFVEKAESVTLAAVRELREETGIEIAEDELIPLFISSVISTNQLYITFRTHLQAPAELNLGDEASEGGWFSRDNFPKEEFWLPNLLPAVDEFFDCVDSGKHKLYMSDWSENDMHNRAFDFNV